MIEKENNRILSRMIQPIRIVSLISLSWWLFNGDSVSDPSLIFAYYFIFLYPASFGVELVLTSPINGLCKRFILLSTKFAQMLPVEFIGIFGSALLVFAPSTIRTSLTIEVLSFVIICGIGIELYHLFVVSHLNKIKVAPQISTLAVIALTLITFFQGFYFLVLSPHHLVFIQ